MQTSGNHAMWVQSSFTSCVKQGHYIQIQIELWRQGPTHSYESCSTAPEDKKARLPGHKVTPIFRVVGPIVFCRLLPTDLANLQLSIRLARIVIQLFNYAALLGSLNLIGLDGLNSARETSHFPGVISLLYQCHMLLRGAWCHQQHFPSSHFLSLDAQLKELRSYCLLQLLC